MGRFAPRFRRFPLLLKFLDAHEMLSVQVHPSDAYPDLIPAGETGKTEAWVVIEADKKSHIYAGLKPGTTADGLRHSIAGGAIADCLVGIVPKPGDAVFIPAGTVHTLGNDIVVFEVQQDSDVCLLYTSTVGAWFFIYKLEPETKGKTLEQIEEHWRKGKPQQA